MGVSGSGKSTIGKLLAENLNVPFYDADDYHPPENIEKMSSGNPLNDQDRQGWLEKLNALLINSHQSGLVLACSALKENYRKIIAHRLDRELLWVYLEGSYQEIMERLRQRKEHFMPSALLISQFETLEVPDYALKVHIGSPPTIIIQEILSKIEKAP